MYQMIHGIKKEDVIFGTRTQYADQVDYFKQVEIYGTLNKIGIYIVTEIEDSEKLDQLLGH